MKKLSWIWLLLVAITACSKKEPPAAPPPATPAAGDAPAAAPAPAPVQRPVTAPPPTSPVAKPKVQPPSGVKPLAGRVDPHMTALLQKFLREKGRMPNSVLELGGATSDSFPLAPQGYIYAIDPATAEVKLVKL